MLQLPGRPVVWLLAALLMPMFCSAMLLVPMSAKTPWQVAFERIDVGMTRDQVRAILWDVAGRPEAARMVWSPGEERGLIGTQSGFKRQDFVAPPVYTEYEADTPVVMGGESIWVKEFIRVRYDKQGRVEAATYEMLRSPSLAQVLGYRYRKFRYKVRAWLGL
jgi:hypothetical protein